MAKTRMDFLSTDVKRQKELSDAEATSVKQYQLVLSDYRTQQVLLRSLEEKLKIMGINPQRLSVGNISRTVPLRSPIRGFVSKVNVNIGKYVNPSDVLFELVNPDDIHAAINIFEKDLSSIRKGMRGTVSLADKPAKTYNVEVLLVTRSIDETRTGIVHCHFENQSHDLLPGMYLSATFNIDNKQVYAVPEEAIVRYSGKHYVFIARSTRNFFMKEVGIGITQNGYTELMNDPRVKWQDASVVITGAYALLGKLKNTSDD
jgi:cobalt-zinc-cadmium efflux system membrane fusion protein